MQSLLELLPLLVFLVAYYLHGMYAATAALMVAMVVLLGLDLLTQRRIPPMHALSTALVLVFGSATLILHDQRFIQWKPTVFFWLVSAAFLVSAWLGKQPLVERLLGKALGAEARVPQSTWRRLNWLWIAFYAALGVLNLIVAFHASQRTWVNFKVFGLTALTAVFIAAQLIWLSRRPQASASSAAT